MVKLKSKRIEVKNIESKPVEVVNISLISSVGVADGKMLPVIFLECRNRPDIDELLRNHSQLGSGNGRIESCFGRKSRLNNDSILLFLRFKEPYECTIIVDFSLENHAAGVDLLVKNQGCYIQSNSKGNMLSQTMTEPRILIEIPCDQISDEWEEIYYKVTVNRFIRKGFKKKKGKELAKLMIAELRKIDIRM